VTFSSIFIKTSLLTGFLFLTACSNTPQTNALLKSSVFVNNMVHTISDVPFYPQSEYYCGPTTLSEVFAYHGKNIDVEKIASKIFIPGKKGSLQIEMVAATRQYDFSAYAKQGSLIEILQLVENNIPVIVFQNNGLSWAPSWHYAVVIGYDIAAKSIILHTGLSENYRIPFAVFERTWNRGNNWFLAPLPIGITFNILDPYLYTKSAYDMLEIGREHTAIANIRAAIDQWPEYWLGYFLLGNYNLSTDKPKALAWYAKGFPYAKNEPAFLNNYAYVLWELGCQQESQQILTYALGNFPNNKDLQSTYLETENSRDAYKGICPTSLN